ncbi:MAG: protein phosphatase 2C domain-containing protein, partial [Proteobacteria bacterium]|nr:protein phosphatase 2C domain-containing protein [Pseudomonadota bacterium]
MTGRASIVGAAVTHVGKVREHNEDAHMFDGDNGLFLVCDGMGGHAAGEVASAIAIRTVRSRWADDATHRAIDAFLADGSPGARRHMIGVLRDGVLAAHDAIIAEANRDSEKAGMGTTLVAAIVVGGDVVFAHAGDSRGYLVRDNIAMQLTEDHTLLSRLLAAGIDVDLTGEGARFKSMLTNALGIVQECKVSTFIVPLADGDRFLLCSDGISEYVQEAEVGEVLSKSASPSRAAQKLVDLALERGGGDNATALVVRVLEAGLSPLPVERRKRDDEVIAACPLWGLRVNPQQRLRALRIAIPREHTPGEKVPAQTFGDRVAWIIIEGQVEQDGKLLGPATLLYPEALIATGTLPDKDGLAIATTEVRMLAIRADDFREICEEDAELGEALLDSLVNVIARRGRETARIAVQREGRAPTDPGDSTEESTVILTKPQPPLGEPLLPPVGEPAPPEPDPASSRTTTRPETQYGRAKTNPPVRVDVPARMTDDEAGRASTAQQAAVRPPPETIPPPIAVA